MTKTLIPKKSENFYYETSLWFNFAIIIYLPKTLDNSVMKNIIYNVKNHWADV
jgi:hypothetical protein